MLSVNLDCLREANAHFIQPIVAGATSVAVIALGHKFAVFATTAVWHGGLFGLLQSAIAHQISHRFHFVSKRYPIVDHLITHLLTGAALYGLSLLALKVGLIASVMTLTAATTIITVSTVMGLITILAGNSVAERLAPPVKR